MPGDCIGALEKAEQEAAQRVLQAYGKVSPRQFLALVSLWTGISTVTGVCSEPEDLEAWKAWIRTAKTIPGSSEGPPDAPPWKPRAQFRKIETVCRKDSPWVLASDGQMPRWVGLIDLGAPREGYFPPGEEARMIALSVMGLLGRATGGENDLIRREVLHASRVLTQKLTMVYEPEGETDRR